MPGSELADLRPPEGNLHRFRWDQALGFAQWLLKDEYPADVTVWLVEGESFEAGAPLTPAGAGRRGTCRRRDRADRPRTSGGDGGV